VKITEFGIFTETIFIIPYFLIFLVYTLEKSSSPLSPSPEIANPAISGEGDASSGFSRRPALTAMIRSSVSPLRLRQKTPLLQNRALTILEKGPGDEDFLNQLKRTRWKISSIPELT
jgi:hypothetical protein